MGFATFVCALIVVGTIRKGWCLPLANLETAEAGRPPIAGGLSVDEAAPEGRWSRSVLPADVREQRAVEPDALRLPAPGRRAAKPDALRPPAPGRRAAEPDALRPPAPGRRAAEPDALRPPAPGRRAAKPNALRPPAPSRSASVHGRKLAPDRRWGRD